MSVQGSRSAAALSTVFAVFAACLSGAGSAAADSIAIQDDGKIVVVGEMSPSFAAIGRVDADGRLDPSFGQGGFVVDRRLPVLKSIALQPDGRILVGAVEGFRLARYLPDGSPDAGFGAGGIGGTRDPAQDDFLYGDLGPETILARAGGDIVVGGTQDAGRWDAPQAIARRYDANGNFLETVGEVPQLDGAATFESHLRGLLLAADGSLLGAGWTYVSSSAETGSRTLLARFVPGSGTGYDPAFGGGQGLVRVAFPSQNQYASNYGQALARQGDALLVAGTSDDTFLLARFDAQGRLDQGFAGGSGAARPPIAGTSGKDGSSWAQAIAVGADGGAVIGGGTSRWGEFGFLGKLIYGCMRGCPQPLLARFTADGQLDPSFGSGGLLRLLSPSGEAIEGQVEQLAELPGGKLLVKGKVAGKYPQRAVSSSFLARLNADGSYDPSFGEGGLTILDFPCGGTDRAVLEQEGCLAHAVLRLRLRGAATGHPRLSLRVQPDVPWARVRDVVLTLPKALRPTRRLGPRSRVTGLSGADGKRLRLPGPRLTKKGRLHFAAKRLPIGLSARLLPGALRIVGKPQKRRTLVFRVSVSFVHGKYALVGTPTVVLRRRGA